MWIRQSEPVRMRFLAVVLSLVLAAVLAVTLAEAPASAAPLPAQVPSQGAAEPEVTEADDIPSARATARTMGRRIEALSERTESTSTFVNPDGTATASIHSGPIRVLRGDAWLPVDLTLVKSSDGSIRPHAHPRDLVLAGAGTSQEPRDLATVRSGESEAALQWRGRLPEPVLTGATATYPNVWPNADLVVTATRTGFEQFVILKARPAGGLRLSLGLRTKGVTARETDNGNTELVDAAGAVIGAVPAPDMWDATVDPRSGDPVRRRPVAKQVGSLVGGLTGGALDVALIPDLGFLRDTATVYPVTIDPAVSIAYNTFDTYTQIGTTSDQSTAGELRLGSFDGGATKARTYLHFDMSPFRGKRIVSSKLWLYATHSYSCAPRNWEVWSSALVGTGTRWTNQPGLLERFVTTGATTGYEPGGCGDGWLGTDIRGLTQRWADENFTTAGVMLKAENENDSFGWKKFASGEGGAPPHIEVTYNTRPNPVTGLTVSDRGDNAGQVFTRSTTPTLSFTPSDPDGDAVTAIFYVYGADGTLIHDQPVGPVASGAAATWQVPAGMLAAGGNYRFRATTFDGHDFADDAWVAIRSEHSGLYVDVEGCGRNNGTRVIQWFGNGADCQKFYLSGTGGGYYQFKVRHSGQVLDNSGCRTNNLNPIITYDQVGDPALNDCQEWTLNRLGGGVYSFTVRNAGKVLDQGCTTSTEPRSILFIYDRSDNLCQRFRLEPSPANGAVVQWLDVTVDTTAPGAPFVGSTQYPADNTWHGAAGTPGTFTFTPPANTPDVAGYLWGLDVVPATEAPGAGPVNVSITPATDGQHVLNVRTKDRAGNLSAITSYAFQVGRAGLTRPSDGARVPRRTVLQVDAQPGFTHVKYMYRRGEGAAVEADIPAANLTRPDGTALGAGFVPWSAGAAGAAVWTAVDTVGSAAGVVQVKAVLATNSAGAGAYATVWRTMVIDPDADGAASQEVGPGAVNMLTGDYGVDAQDVEEFGLTVSRTSSSRDPRAGYQTQRERLTANEQRVSVDTTGFLPTYSTVARVTNRGHTGNDSLQLTPDAASGSTDTFAAVDAEYTMALGLRPGRQYRMTGWIYVPAATGLAAPDPRGLSLSAHFLNGTYQDVRSPRPTVVDAWQQLTLDFTVPAGATQAFVRVYNGHARGSGKPVFYDDLCLRELTAPFGPAWSTGTAADASGVDYTRMSFEADTDNTVARIDTASGGSTWFTRALDGRFFPEPGAEDLTLTPDGPDFRLAELDGTVTMFAQQGGSTAYLVSSTTPPVAASMSQYQYEIADDRLRVARVIAPSEVGVGDCTTPTPARGCEALQYSYATATTGTSSVPGDFVDQVRAISVWTTDPANGSVSLSEVSRYAYDDLGRLREVWDPRTSPVLKIRYEYDAAGRVITLTPPGELPWRFDLGQAGPTAGPAADLNTGRLLKVRRAALRQGTTNQVDGELVSTMVYSVPLTRAGGGPHNMDGASVATWAQTEAPTDAVALFGPEDPPPVTTATSTAPGADGYRAATVTYLDGSGRAVNVATPGGWIDTTAYDRFGNVVRTLDATNRLRALNPQAFGADELGLTQLDSPTRATRLDSQTTYSLDGIDQLRATGPLHRVVLPEDPNLMVNARLVTENTYDENKPDGTAYHLITATLAYAQVDGRPDRHDPRLTRSGYAPAIGGTSGWVVRAPTQVTVNLKVPETAAGAADEALTSYIRYDDRGRALESRKPGSTGTDAATTRSVFWTAGANPDDGACGNRPEWAGQPCATRAGGAVTGHDPGRMPTDLSVKRITAYNRFGDPTTVTETAAGQTRTTTTAYDPVGRVTSVAITGTLGQAIQTVSTTYDPNSGDATATRFADNTTLTRVFDQLGRLARYTDADGGWTATEFDRFGKPVRITDSIGTTQTMTYDRAREPRGLLTGITDSVAGSYEATYGPDEQVQTVAMPGGTLMVQLFDPTGTPVLREYNGTYGEADVVFATSTQTTNVHGQMARLVGPASDQRHTYDSRGQLIRTADTNTATGGCVTRVYTHDAHANRRSKTTRTGTTAGICPTDTTTPTSATTHTYDTADRITDPGYRYDGFGRITNLPTAGGPEVVQTFHVNDLIASQTQADQRLSWTLDPAHRFRTYRSERFINNAWANAVTKINHYGDDSDEPRWITEDATLPDNLTRNIPGFDGNLMATTAKTGAPTLQMTNLHGDIMATLPIPGITPGNFPWGATTVHDTDEFGIPKTTATANARYSWLGGPQRSSDTLGDTILMGARIYHPTSGRFLSPDPEPGGNASTYDYCAADPVNCTDLDGRWAWLRKAAGVIARVGEIAAWIPGPIGAAAGAISAGAYAATGNRRKALEMGLTAAANLVGAGAAVKIGFAAARYGAKALRAAPRALKKARAAVACVRNSFIPTTLVLMADGTTRQIDHVAVGDLVATTDPDTGETVSQPVLNVIIGYGDKGLVQFEPGGTGTPITATATHPIWVDGRGWTAAIDIGIGDRVLLPGGGTVSIRKVRDLGVVHEQLVYNLTVGGLHTYSVVAAETPVVVHNASCPARGVYVLHYANGDRYVGRSINVGRRVSAHMRGAARRNESISHVSLHRFPSGTGIRGMRVREQAYINIQRRQLARQGNGTLRNRRNEIVFRRR